VLAIQEDEAVLRHWPVQYLAHTRRGQLLPTPSLASGAKLGMSYVRQVPQSFPHSFGRGPLFFLAIVESFCQASFVPAPNAMAFITSCGYAV
jgi:hypothetical protein